jgi:hypothetical protein
MTIVMFLINNRAAKHRFGVNFTTATLINQIDYLYKDIANLYDINPTGIHNSP